MMNVSIEKLAEKFHQSIPKVIEANLKAGVSVYYENEKGQWIKENPDGTIEVIKEAL